MEYESKKRDWKLLDDNRVQVMRSANSEVGLLSVDGITQTRNKFWNNLERVSAMSRQSKWDAFFMGISALQKNEKIGSYSYVSLQCYFQPYAWVDYVINLLVCSLGH